MNIIQFHLKMKRTNGTGSAAKLLRGVIVSALLLWSFGGQAMAQGNDKKVVIKKNISVTGATNETHYLAHVKVNGEWVLQDATTFSPNCIWYTGTNFNRAGTNHNFYFIDPDDAENPHFLSAPMTAGGSLSLSASKPPTYALSNTDLNYYFYDWDKKGIARGHQVTGVADNEHCNYAFEDGECWQVYWIEYNGSWGLTSTTQGSYGITATAARAYDLTVTEHAAEISGAPTGGLTALSVANTEMTYNTNQTPSVTVSSLTYNYTPAYTSYTFNEVINEDGTTAERNIYYKDGTPVNAVPGPTDNTSAATAYEWTLTGPGAEYLSFASDDDVRTSTSTTPPVIYYRTENLTGHKTATLILKVTFGSGSSLVEQTETVTITVKTNCANPAQASAPVVTFDGATVTWNLTAEKYQVEWKKSDGSWSTPVEVVGSNSYTITGLDYNATYNYRVTAYCGDAYLSAPDQATGSFTTGDEPGLVIGGAVFGGGRMADVSGKTEVIVINCDTLGAVYGGNDIAGSVLGAAGSLITLGVNSGDAHSYDSYGTTSANLKIGSVYGGGNGYYAYNGSSFVAADNEHTSQTVAVSRSVNAMTQQHTVGAAAWTNTGSESVTLNIPTIVKTNITVTNNYVKVDSIFGGAKNAFIYLDDANANGSTITVNGGTVYALFGGNNFGGTQKSAKHHIDVTGTKTYLTPNVDNNSANSYGRTFGIRYLFGGGNKVAGSTTEITVTGGQVDTLFGGGNSADVAAANVTVNCALGSGSGVTFNKTYSYAISSYSSEVAIKNDYAWNGTGVYNVRTLFGGNNAADMAGLPTITLTAGSVGTVYGGGNAGDMLAQIADAGGTKGLIADVFGSPIVDDVEQTIYYGTHVVMNSADMLVDYLYGGCQMSNVNYSTWVEISGGHVGTVYGGCNISGDVGSHYNITYSSGMPGDQYQYVRGATYVNTTAGTIYGNLFAGSNGFYHCNDGQKYISGIDYDDPEHYYIGLDIPTHNETNVNVSGTVTVKGNVYAGGNLAPVGFITEGPGYIHRTFVGMATIRMSGGIVEGSVYGGGNMASIFGSNEVLVSGGTINGALYGGNDRAGQVAQITNRVLTGNDKASDGQTSLNTLDVHTYVEITGTPKINTVYGGGNGAYIYEGSQADMQYCDVTDQPIQTNTFVDINLDGFPNSTDGGYIETVYGGGNGVTVTGGITVLMNVKGNGVGVAPVAYDHIGTIFGGNNMGALAIVPDIILLNGQVNTVYGGCNQGAMEGGITVTDADSRTYENVGSLVHLRDSYTGAGSSTTLTPAATVSGAIYGGCRMNGVTNNTLVLIEAGTHSCAIYGGSDISGDICGKTQVVINGGSIVDAYGGGNGNYYYNAGNAYEAANHSNLVAEGVSGAPYCKDSRVYMYDGAATNLYAGGYAGLCGDTYMEMNDGTVSGNIFGGGNQAGTTTVASAAGCSGTGTSEVVMNGGTVTTSVFGGCNSSGSIASTSTVTINGATLATNVFGGGKGEATSVAGNVLVTIGTEDGTGTPAVSTVYGGSEEGTVNTNSSNTTIVNILNGTISTAVYGGGKGVTGNATKGQVNGAVTVNIGGENQDDADCNISMTGCTVYGCNNAGGSPKDAVAVHVWRTGHITTNEATYEGNSPTYAIDQVFGGGNAADYTPSGSQKATVYIHNCANTVRRVFGGGNAAAVPGISTTIDGGRFDYVFGGGNGEVTAANITTSGITLLIHAGKINQLYNGSNANGTITGGISATLEHTTVCPDDDIDVDEYFCGNNAADISGNVITTIACSEDNPIKVTSLYGGSNVANIDGNVELTINGGIITNVYGGSKGRLDNPETPGVNEARTATITGHVILTIHGGTIKNVFGGCNILGDIQGPITVNVFQDGECTLNLDNVYGGGNMAAYNPQTAKVGADRIVPMVNIQKGTVNDQVFGGGYGNTAVVTANPKVVVGGEVSSETYQCVIGNTTIDSGVGAGNVYGGGNAAQVSGNTQVLILNKTTVNGNVYGGGNAAGVTGSTDVQIGD